MPKNLAPIDILLYGLLLLVGGFATGVFLLVPNDVLVTWLVYGGF